MKYLAATMDEKKVLLKPERFLHEKFIVEKGGVRSFARDCSISLRTPRTRIGG